MIVWRIGDEHALTEMTRGTRGRGGSDNNGKSAKKKNNLASASDSSVGAVPPPPTTSTPFSKFLNFSSFSFALFFVGLSLFVHKNGC